jgi:hypothetical protein
LAQPAIGFEIARETEQTGPIGQIEPRPDDQLDGMFLGGGMRAHHPGQAVTVGDGDGAISQRLGGDHQLVRIRCPFEEGEIAGDLEFGIVRQTAHERTTAPG